MIADRALKIDANQWAKRILNSIFDVVFPSKCLVCSRLFVPFRSDPGFKRTPDAPAGPFDPPTESSKQLSAYCCPDCIDALAFVSSPMCTSCGIMFKGRQDEDHLCGDCLQKPKEFRIARAAMVYDPQLMAVIHRFKYAAKIQLARPLGGLMLGAYMRHWSKEKFDLILPVPLHSKKFRKRGFNQAFLLIYSWQAPSKALPVDLTGNLNTDILIRNQATGPQTGLGRQQRLKNIEGAFSVRFSEKVDAQKILVIDDVYTTGATVNECARILLEAGANSVDVLTLARTI